MSSSLLELVYAPTSSPKIARQRQPVWKQLKNRFYAGTSTFSVRFGNAFGPGIRL